MSEDKTLNYNIEELSKIPIISPKKILYIEDKNGIFPYSYFLERNSILKDKNIEIYPTNNKKNAISIYKILKKRKEIKKVAFIIDRDYDFVLKKNIINDERMIYLEKYTLENYYITEDLWEILLASSLNKSLTDIRNSHSFEKFKFRIRKEYLKLVPFFIIISKYNLNMQYSKNSHIKDYFKDLDYCTNCSKNKTTEYFKECDKKRKSKKKIEMVCCRKKIKELIIKLSKEEKIDLKKEYIFWRRKIRKSDIFDLVPGKSLLKIFLEYVKNETGREIKKGEIKIIEVEKVDSSIDKVISKLEKILQ